MTLSNRQRAIARRNRPKVTLPPDRWTGNQEPAPSNAPTPERMAKGEWEVGSATGAHRCTNSIPLHYAAKRGKISNAQLKAGEAYGEMRTAAIRIRCGGAQRDSLDNAPRGGGEPSPEYAARIMARDNECSAAIGYHAQTVADDFIVHGRSGTKYELTRRWWRDTHDALTMLVAFFGTGER